MTEPIVLFVASSLISLVVGYYAGQLAAERRMTSLEGAVAALGQKFDFASAGLNQRLVEMKEDVEKSVDGLRDEVRQYYQRRPGR